MGRSGHIRRLYDIGASGLGHCPAQGYNTGYTVFAQTIIAHVVFAALDRLAHDSLETGQLGLIEHTLKDRVLYPHAKALEVSMQPCPSAIIGNIIAHNKKHGPLLSAW